MCRPIIFLCVGGQCGGCSELLHKDQNVVDLLYFCVGAVW